MTGLYSQQERIVHELIQRGEERDRGSRWGELLPDAFAPPEERRLRCQLRTAEAEIRKLEWKCERWERDRTRLERKNEEQERELQNLRIVVEALTNGDKEETEEERAPIGFS